jgi:hypothetical protein
MPEFIVTSAVTGAGKALLLDFIEANNQLYQAF